MEQWKSVVGYEGIYEVSSNGNVRRIARAMGTRPGRILKFDTRGGYRNVVLSWNDKIKRCRVSRLVAEAFIGRPTQGQVVNHLDGNGLNNRAQNLEWTTHSGNLQHAYDNVLRKAPFLGRYGTTSAQWKLTEDDIVSIRERARLGESQRALAIQHGVHHCYIWLIVHNRVRQHG